MLTDDELGSKYRMIDKGSITKITYYDAFNNEFSYISLNYPEKPRINHKP